MRSTSSGFDDFGTSDILMGSWWWTGWSCIVDITGVHDGLDDDSRRGIEGLLEVNNDNDGDDDGADDITGDDNTEDDWGDGHDESPNKA